MKKISLIAAAALVFAGAQLHAQTAAAKQDTSKKAKPAAGAMQAGAAKKAEAKAEPKAEMKKAEKKSEMAPKAAPKADAAAKPAAKKSAKKSAKKADTTAAKKP